ncbi:MAG: TetR/AcrR family transcriptional regulator [Bacteroidota bacterium]
MPLQKITKEEIIKISIRVFRDKGYHNTSMSDLAKACGLTKGLFYHYFKNKHEMMEVVLREVSSGFSKKVFSIAYQDELSHIERAKMMAIKCLNLFSGEKGGCIMGNSILESLHGTPEFKVSIRRFFDEWIKAFEYLFSARYGKGEASQMAKEAVGEIEGAIMLMQLYDDQSYLERVLKKIIKRF